ncbi:four helix bundle protein [Patescibacteria group bacterium]|nr:four helix bundle protein [Patescibacteria group bacterium]MBU1896067.1 four helix bundle protein [Patescibacteria group bacterium]
MLSYRDLIVWQKAMDLVVAVYELTELYPREEMYGLAAHTRKTSVSIPSNIAEGKLRGTRKDYRHFIVNAYASGAELETQIEIAKRLSFGKNLNLKKIDDLLEEVMKMLNTLIRKLQS